MEHDAWFFIGVFVFVFIVWIAVGGPLHPLAFSGPTLAEPQELGGGTYLQFPRAAFSIGRSEVTLPGSSNGQSINGAGSDIPAPVYGIAFGTPSPYRSLVTLSNYVSNASSTSEYVEISVSQNAGAPVDISGWVLGSGATGNTATIPRGTAVPTSGVVNASQDIVLQPGERAVISSGKSPVGASFRENKCTGYFNTFQKFYPSLPQNCPVASNELSTFYPGITYIHDPACVDYTSTISRCQIPLTRTAKVNATCQSFLENYLNYNGCVIAHRNDPDFNGTTWHIYLNNVNSKGQTVPLWRATHEFIKLFDANLKTIAQFSY